MTEPEVLVALDRASRFQAVIDGLGAGRPRPGLVAFHETGLGATLTIEVAVVRSAKPRRCSVCHHRRVCFALTFVDRPIGNAEPEWRCAPDAGLRP